MATLRRVGGYVDRQELNKAMQANKQARRILGRIIEERPGQGRLAFMLAEVALHLSTMMEAMMAMDRIRVDYQRGEAEQR